MSRRNSLENKRIRRAEREANAALQKKKRLTARMVNASLGFTTPPEAPKVSDLVIAETMLWTPEMQNKENEPG